MYIDQSFFIILSILSITIYLFLHKQPKSPVVVDLIYYPIKSCAGIHLKKALVSEFGIKNDRLWALSLDNKIVDQEDNPLISKLQPSFRFSSSGEHTHLVLSYFSHPDFLLELKSSKSKPVKFSLYGSEGTYVDEGDQVSQYLSTVFSKPYRLIKIVQGRPLKDVRETSQKEGTLSFMSEGQVLVTSNNSLEALRDLAPYYIKADIHMDSFRPNIVIKHSRAFEEDNWNKFSIGKIDFAQIKKCDRCRVITINKENLFDSNCEPLNTLRKHHGDGVKGFFGILARHTRNGDIMIGDKVKVHR